MGLTGWIKQKLEGDPEERKFHKEVNAEAKAIEKEAFHEQYKTSKLERAKERGKEKAIAQVAKGGQGGGGLLNTLGNIGANMNKASKGLVAGIEINPDGNSGQNPFNVRDPLSMDAGYESTPRHKRTKHESSLETVDPFDLNQ